RVRTPRSSEHPILPSPRLVPASPAPGERCPSFLRYSVLSFAPLASLLVQPLQHRSHNQRQSNRGVDKYFSKPSAFCRRHKFSPRHRLAVGTARQSTPIDRLRTNPQPIVIALQRNVLPQPPVP